MNIANPRLEGAELHDDDTKVLLLRAVFGPAPQSDERGLKYIFGQLVINVEVTANEMKHRCYQWPDCPVCGGT